MKKIGFIGLGHMGGRMAKNLVQAGMEVTVYDIAPKAVIALVEVGAIAAKSIADVAKDKDVVITMVQTGEQVSEICSGEHGIFNSMEKGAVYIDCSTIDIVNTRNLHENAAEKGIRMLDAPVSGGIAGAESATLTFMVGGEKDLYDKVRPVLSAMGKKVIHAGDATSGQAAKICNNLILATSMIGVCESFVLAKKLGLDLKKFFDISSNASGQCWSMTSYCPVPGIIDDVPSNNHYKPGFMAKMMLKDLRLAQHAAEAVDVPIPLGGMATELYELFVSRGGDSTDFSGIINMLDDEMDITN